MRFQAKWKPVRVKKTRQIENPEPRFDSIEAEKALELPFFVFIQELLFLFAEVAMTQDLYCAVGIVTALIEYPAAAFFVAFVRRIATASFRSSRSRAIARDETFVRPDVRTPSACALPATPSPACCPERRATQVGRQSPFRLFSFRRCALLVPLWRRGADDRP
jgi:hypothetical protein